MAQNLALRPIFHALLEVFAMSIWSKTNVKQVKKFWENDQNLEFSLTLGSKMAQKNWDFGAHILHIAESICNEHIM